MTTTGTALFNLDLSDIIEESIERCGHELRSGYEFRTARRSLNILFAQWANQGLNAWTLEQLSIPLVQNVGTYDLPVDTVDLLDSVTRIGTGQQQSDLNINRISGSTYLAIPNKNATGRPIQVWVNRQSGADYPVTGVNAPKIVIWPMPDQGTLVQPYYTFIAHRLRRMQDAGDGVNSQDIPFRFLPALISGLAFQLSMKLPNVDPARIAMLKADYDEEFELAMQGDHDQSSWRIIPRIAMRP